MQADAIIFLVLFTVLGSAALYFDHEIRKSEDNRCLVSSEQIVANIQEKKDEIRSAPVDNSVVIKRLFDGSY